MSKRGTRYVYDSGTIWRMTDRQYRNYIFRNARAFSPVSQYGTPVGQSSFNATRATMCDYEDEEQRLRDEDKAARIPKDDDRGAR